MSATSEARPVVLATRELPEPFETLRADFEVRVLGYAPSELELAAEVAGRRRPDLSGRRPGDGRRHPGGATA